MQKEISYNAAVACDLFTIRKKHSHLDVSMVLSLPAHLILFCTKNP